MSDDTPLISDKSLQALLRQYGNASIDPNAAEYVRQTLDHAARREFSAIVQSGGRVLMPSEFFGTDSGRYAATPGHTSMAATAAIARPALLQHGGAPRKPVVSRTALKSMNKKQGERKLGAPMLQAAARHIDAAVESIAQRMQALVKSPKGRVGKSHAVKAASEHRRTKKTKT